MANENQSKITKDQVKNITFADIYATLDNTNGMMLNEIKRLSSIIKTYTGVEVIPIERVPLANDSIITGLNSLSLENRELINHLSNIITELEFKIK